MKKAWRQRGRVDRRVLQHSASSGHLLISAQIWWLNKDLLGHCMHSFSLISVPFFSAPNPIAHSILNSATMVFANKSYGVATPADRFGKATKKHPVLLFGLPFLLTVVVGSFALSELTATKYNVHDHRTKSVTSTLDILSGF